MNAEEIVRTYSDMVYGIAFRYMKNKEDAEDVYSETFLTYFKKEREFNDEEHRKAWLITVTVNNAKSMLAERRYDEDIDEAVGISNPRKSVGKADLIDLRDAIDRLKPDYKEVILLFYMNDLSVREIGQILDLNENTVKIRLSRARKMMKEYLGGPDD